MIDQPVTLRRSNRNGTSTWHHNGSNGYVLADSNHASINCNAEGNRRVALNSDHTRRVHSSLHDECEDDAHSSNHGSAIVLETIEYTGVDEHGDKASENESTRRSLSRRSLSIKNKDLDVDVDDDSAGDSDSEGGLCDSIRIATMEEASSDEEDDSEGEVQQEFRPPPRSPTKSLRDTSETSISSSIPSSATFSENGESSGVLFNREESLRLSTMEDIANWDEHDSEEEQIELRKSFRRSLSVACSDCGDSSSHLNGDDSKELSWMESHLSSHTSVTTDADENEKHDVLTPMVATPAGKSRFRRRSSSLEELMLSQNLSFEPSVSTQASAYGFGYSRDSSCKTVESEKSATLEDLMMSSPLQKASVNKAANSDSQQSMNDIFHDTIQWEGSFNFSPSPQDKLPTISTHTATTVSPTSKTDNGSSGAGSDGIEEVECLPDDGSKTIRFASKALIIGDGESVTTCDVSTKGFFYIGNRNCSSSNKSFSAKGIACEDGSSSESLPEDSTKWFESDIWEDVARREYDDDEYSFISCESEEERLNMWDKNQIANDRLKKSLIWSLGGYAVSSIIAIFTRRLTRENIDEEVNDDLVDAAAEGTRRSISSKSGSSYGTEGEAYNGVVDTAAGETKRRSIDAVYGYGDAAADAAAGETKRRSIDAIYGYGDVASGETKRRSIEAGAYGAPEGSESCSAPSSEFVAANAIAAAATATSVAALASNTSGSAAGGASLATKTKEQSAAGGASMALTAAAAVAAVSANTQVVQSMAVSAASNAAKSGVSGSSAVMGMGSEGRKGTVSALGLTTSIAAAMAVVAIGGATVYTTPQRIEQRAGSPDAGLSASAFDCAHENPDMESEKIVFTLDIPIGVVEIDTEGWEEIFAEAYNNLTDFGCDDLFQRHIDEGNVILLNATRQNTTEEMKDSLFDSTEELLETEWNVTVSCWEECPDEAAFGADLGANTRRRNMQESDADSPVDNDSEENSDKDEVQDELQNLINKLEFRETFEEALRFHHGLGKRKPGGSANGDGKSVDDEESSSDFPSDFPSLEPSDGPSSLPSEAPSVGVGNSDGNGESKSDAESDLTNDGHSTMPSNFPSERPSTLPSIYPSGAGRSSGIDEETPGTSPDEGKNALPSVIPSEEPTNRDGENKPDSTDTRPPTMKPTKNPTKSPTSNPTKTPTKLPTTRPTKSPTVLPSVNPTKSPTIMPTVSPSKFFTGNPTASQSTRPSVSPSESPTFASESPSLSPSESPSSTSSELLSTKPSQLPSGSPLPTATPSEEPSKSPSKSSLPSLNPSESPSVTLSEPPSRLPSESPSEIPSRLPTASPSEEPSESPSESWLPSLNPSESPSATPSAPPSLLPSGSPSESPSRLPSESPSELPSPLPSHIPSELPSEIPSDPPSQGPSGSPTESPSKLPSEGPSDPPSQVPSVIPSESPSQLPSESRPTTPAPTPNPPDSSRACCSQSFAECIPVNTCTPYEEARCEGTDGQGPGCWDGKVRWLHAGEPPAGSCLARYTGYCHNEALPCCYPGECRMTSPFYSQCLHWVDDNYWSSF